MTCTLSHEKSFIFTDLPTGVELMTTLESEGLTDAEMMVSSILKDLCLVDLSEGNISNENIEFVFCILIVYFCLAAGDIGIGRVGLFSCWRYRYRKGWVV